MSQTILTDGDFTPLDGWPCRPFLTDAPAIADKLTAPSADELLPQILALAPRGAAWGTDENGDGEDASPNLRAQYLAIATWSAASYARDADIAAQAFPSLASWSLDDWEAEYGLPDRCVGDAQTVADRLQALRVKYALVGAASPQYLICLAASLGYPIFIEEYQPLRCDDFRAGWRAFDLGWGDVFKVHAPTVTVRPLYCDSFYAGDRVLSWGNAELECAIRAAAQPQTVPIFAYDVDPDGGALDSFTLDDGSGAGDKLT